MPSGEQHQTSRRLAAILAADVVRYSRLMADDEVGTLGGLKTHRRELIDPAIAAHHGRIVKTTGDGLLAEFNRRERRSASGDGAAGDSVLP
jgi:adenylate cyclase